VGSDELVFPRRCWIQNENCRYLNVWTHQLNAAAKEPVVVWMRRRIYQLQSRWPIPTARLHEDFYGMPARHDLLRERLVKEASHELGHTFGLRHCADWRCVMASSHAVERLDVKDAAFCEACRKPVLQNGRWFF